MAPPVGVRAAEPRRTLPTCRPKTPVPLRLRLLVASFAPRLPGGPLAGVPPRCPAIDAIYGESRPDVAKYEAAHELRDGSASSQGPQRCSCERTAHALRVSLNCTSSLAAPRPRRTRAHLICAAPRAVASYAISWDRPSPNNKTTNGQTALGCMYRASADQPAPGWDAMKAGLQTRRLHHGARICSPAGGAAVIAPCRCRPARPATLPARKRVIPDRKVKAGITARARVAPRFGPSNQYVSRVYCHRQPPPAAGTYVDWYKSSARRARFAITRVTYTR